MMGIDNTDTQWLSVFVKRRTRPFEPCSAL